MRFLVFASFAVAVISVKADQREKLNNRTTLQVCQPGETKIEDCHRCTCLSGGIGWICENKQIKLCCTESPCKPGSSWTNQCNDCTCGPDGKSETCTRKGCILRSRIPYVVNTSRQVPEQSHPNSFLNTTRVPPQQPHQPNHSDVKNISQVSEPHYPVIVPTVSSLLRKSYHPIISKNHSHAQHLYPADRLNNSHQVLQKQDPSVVSNNSYQVPELTIIPIWKNPQETSQEPPEQLNITLVWKTFQGTPQQPHPSLLSNNSQQVPEQLSFAVNLNNSHRVLQQPDRITEADHSRERLQLRNFGYPQPPRWFRVGATDSKSSPYAHWPANDRLCVPGERFNENCNSCICGSDGMSATCTRYIYRPKLRYGTTRHRNTLRCRLGQTFRRRCESCICGPRGSLINCTKLPCKRWNRS